MEKRLCYQIGELSVEPDYYRDSVERQLGSCVIWIRDPHFSSLDDIKVKVNVEDVNYGTGLIAKVETNWGYILGNFLLEQDETKLGLYEEVKRTLLLVKEEYLRNTRNSELTASDLELILKLEQSNSPEIEGVYVRRVKTDRRYSNCAEFLGSEVNRFEDDSSYENKPELCRFLICVGSVLRDEYDFRTQRGFNIENERDINLYKTHMYIERGILDKVLELCEGEGVKELVDGLEDNRREKRTIDISLFENLPMGVIGVKANYDPSEVIFSDRGIVMGKLKYLRPNEEIQIDVDFKNLGLEIV